MVKEKKDINSKTPILPISSVAIAVGVHQRTLRIYDKEKILVPQRTDKNRRYYSLDDLEKAKLILFLTRNLAINLAGVKIILSMLEENKIEPENYMQYVKKIANEAEIDTDKQEDNLEKTSKRGRKPKD